MSYGAFRQCGRQGSNPCGAPRFRRALYLAELRPQGWARLDSNQLPLVWGTATHGSPATLPLWRAGLEPAPLLFVRQALSRLSYSPASSGTRSEPRSPRSERGVLPVRRSRTDLAPPSTSNGRSTQGRDLRVPALTRSSEAERCFPSHSPALRPWIASRRMRVRRPPSYVEELWSPILDLGP